MPDRFYSIADPSRIYINFDKYGKPRNDKEAFLQRVDPIYNESDARWYEISYHIGYSYQKIRIKAIPIDFHKVVHFKLNKSVNGGCCILYYPLLFVILLDKHIYVSCMYHVVY